MSHWQPMNCPQQGSAVGTFITLADHSGQIDLHVLEYVEGRRGCTVQQSIAVVKLWCKDTACHCLSHVVCQQGAHIRRVRMWKLHAVATSVTGLSKCRCGSITTPSDFNCDANGDWHLPHRSLRCWQPTAADTWCPEGWPQTCRCYNWSRCAGTVGCHQMVSDC